jgi:hypothetical protein
MIATGQPACPRCWRKFWRRSKQIPRFEKARLPELISPPPPTHTHEPRDMPRCGALSLLQKPLSY